jgi:hypothetical protein
MIFVTSTVFVTELLNRNGLGFVVEFIYNLGNYLLSLSWETIKKIIAKYLN